MNVHWHPLFRRPYRELDAPWFEIKDYKTVLAKGIANRYVVIHNAMTALLKNIAKTVTQLPPKDRAFLAERLLDSLDETDIEQAWIDEAKRRHEEVRSGRVKPIPADEVYRRIEKLLKR